MDPKKVLGQCPLFSALPEPGLGGLVALVEKIAVKRGAEIFAQGDPCHGFYVVVEGSVKVFRLSPSGREHVLHVARPGQSFGEAALFSGTDFPAFAEALEDSLLLYLPRKAFLALLERRPEMALGMLAGLSQWLRRLVALFEDTVLADVDTRLARFLLQLVENNRGEGKVTLPMQKQVLASHLATTPPTLSRGLARLEQEGLIRVNDLEVEFLDREGLQRRTEQLT